MMKYFEGRSSPAKRKPKPIVNKVKFQLIVDLPQNKSFEHDLVLPGVFKNQLEKNCSNITVIDSRGRSYGVFVYDFEPGFVKIGHASWPMFVVSNVLGGLDITKLCFRLVARNVFQVICFDSYGMEKMRDRNGRVVVKRCLLEVSETTIDEEYLPPPILVDMNHESTLKPSWKAQLIGPKQDGEGEVIYQFHENNKDLEKWLAVGLKGPGWTNLIMVNDVEAGFILISIGEQTYIVDVFNQRGIGVGIIDSSAEETQVWEEWIDVESDNGENDRNFTHECRVKKHKHKKSANPYFLIKFPEVSLTRKFLTVPKYFAREYNLHTYTEGVIAYGHLKFIAKLETKRDVRRPNDLTHVVIVRNWGSFLKHTGFMVGEPIKFELNESKSMVAGKAHFYVC